MILDKPLEIRPRSKIMRFHPHLTDDIEAAADRMLVEQPDRRPDHAARLQRLDAAPAGSRRNADFLGQAGLADIGLTLQNSQDFPVYRIQLI